MTFWTILFLITTATLAIIAWRLRGQVALLGIQNRSLNRELSARDDDDTSALMRRAGDGIFNGIVVIDQQRVVRYLNPPAHNLLGIEGDKIGESLIALTRNHEINDVAARAIGDESIERQPITIRGRACHLWAKTIQAGDDPLIMLVINDISEHVRLDRARRDFVTNISHDIRTPLTTIRLLVDSLLRDGFTEEEVAQTALEQIDGQTERLQRLAQALVDLAAIEAGRKEVRLIPVSLSEMIERVRQSLHEQSRRKDIRIEINAPDTLKALVDPDQIDRVLGNLIDNAIRYAPQGTVVSVTAIEEGDMIRVAVGDEGEGISRYEQERIFERFYRGDISRSTEGSGLGLAIAKHIVGAHGGEIRVDEGGEGTSISFTLIGD